MHKNRVGNTSNYSKNLQFNNTVEDVNFGSNESPIKGMLGSSNKSQMQSSQNIFQKKKVETNPNNYSPLQLELGKLTKLNKTNAIKVPSNEYLADNHSDLGNIKDRKKKRKEEALITAESFRHSDKGDDSYVIDAESTDKVDFEFASEYCHSSACAKLRADKDRLSKRLQKIEQTNQIYKTKLYEKRIESEKIKLEFELLKKKLEDSEKSRDQKSTEITKLKNVLDSKEAGLIEIQQLVRSTEQKFKILEDKNSSLENEVLEYGMIINGMKDTLKKAQCKSEEQDYKERFLNSQIEKLNKELQLQEENQKDEVRSEVAKASKLVKDREEDLRNAFTSEINKLNQQIDSISKNLEGCKLQIAERDYTIQLNEDRRSVLEGDVKNLTEKLSKEKEKNKQSQSEFQGLIKEVEEQLQEKDRVINMNIETFEKEEEAMTEKIAELEKHAVFLKDENSKCQKQIEALNDKIRNQANLILDKDESSKGLRNQIETLSNELNKKKAEQNQQKDLIDRELKKGIQELNRLSSENSELEKINAELKANLEYEQEQIASINDSIKAYESQMQQQAKENANFKKRNELLEKRVRDQETALKETNLSLGSQRASIDKIKHKYESKIERVRSS